MQILRGSHYQPLSTQNDPLVPPNVPQSNNEQSSANGSTAHKSSTYTLSQVSGTRSDNRPVFGDISTSDIQVDILHSRTEGTSSSKMGTLAGVSTLPLHSSVLRTRSALFAQAIISHSPPTTSAKLSPSKSDEAKSPTSPPKERLPSRLNSQGSFRGAAGGELRFKGSNGTRPANQALGSGRAAVTSQGYGVWSLLSSPLVSDPQAYTTAIRMAYCEESDSVASYLQQPITVQQALDVLAACVDLQFDWATTACLTFLEAVPWEDHELAQIAHSMAGLRLGSTSSASVLKRLPLAMSEVADEEVVEGVVRELLATCTLLPQYVDSGCVSGEAVAGGRVGSSARSDSAASVPQLANPPARGTDSSLVADAHPVTPGTARKPPGAAEAAEGRGSVVTTPVQSTSKAARERMSPAQRGSSRQVRGDREDKGGEQTVEYCLPPGVPECRDAVAELLRFSTAGRPAAATQALSPRQVSAGPELQAGEQGLQWLALSERGKRRALKEAFMELREAVWGEEQVGQCEGRAQRYRQVGGKKGGGEGVRGAGANAAGVQEQVRSNGGEEDREVGKQRDGLPEWLHGRDGSLTWLLGVMLEHGMASDVLTWLATDEDLIARIKMWAKRRTDGGEYFRRRGRQLTYGAERAELGAMDASSSVPEAEDKGENAEEESGAALGSSSSGLVGEQEVSALHSVKVAILGTMGAVIAKRLVASRGIRGAFARKWLDVLPSICSVNMAMREEGKALARCMTVDYRPGRSYREGFEICDAQVDSEERAIILFGFNELVVTLPEQEQQALYTSWLQMGVSPAVHKIADVPRDPAPLIRHVSISIRMITSPREKPLSVSNGDVDEPLELPHSASFEHENQKARAGQEASWFSLSGAYKGWLERQGSPC